MTIIMAVDLAQNKSGVAVFDTKKNEFSTNIITPNKTSNNNIYNACSEITLTIVNLLLEHKPDYVCYEVTDWKHENAGRERNVLRALSRAEGSLIGGVAIYRLISGNKITPIPLGANKVKNYFGEKSKIKIAYLLAMEFDLHWDSEQSLIINDDERALSLDETDAMAIAYVFSREFKRQELIQDSKPDTWDKDGIIPYPIKFTDEIPFKGEPHPPKKYQTLKDELGL